MIVDTHVHILDPARFPLAASGGHRPKEHESGTAEQLEEVQRAHGVSHTVLVPFSGYGFDRRSILDAIERGQGRARATVALAADAARADLDMLDRAGVTGVRFDVSNFGPDAVTGRASLLRAIVERGWVAQVQCRARTLSAVADHLAPYAPQIVFDHLGLPNVESSPDEPGFRRLLAFGAEGAWIKLSGAFRCSRRRFPHVDLDPFVAALLDAFPTERRVWGSDWPFVGRHPPPPYAETQAMLERWLPDPEERRLALGPNAARLFRF